MRSTAIAYPPEDLVGWERSLMAFLVEKERRSGSRRTVEGYSRMLQDLSGRLGKTPDEVTAQEVFVWAHGKGVSGEDPSPITIGARMACVSSFFRFLQRMEIVDRNPCDRLERPRTSPSPPRGLSALEVQKLLAAAPVTRNRSAQPRPPPHPAPHRPTTSRGLPPDPWRSLLRWRRLLLLLSGQRRKTGSAGTPRAHRGGAQSRAAGSGPGACGDDGPLRVLVGRHEAAPSTRSSSGTSETRGSLLPGSTSSATPPPSSGAMRARLLRTCLGSWTIRLSR